MCVSNFILISVVVVSQHSCTSSSQKREQLLTLGAGSSPQEEKKKRKVFSHGKTCQEKINTEHFLPLFQIFETLILNQIFSFLCPKSVLRTSVLPYEIGWAACFLLNSWNGSACEPLHAAF